MKGARRDGRPFAGPGKDPQVENELAWRGVQAKFGRGLGRYLAPAELVSLSARRWRSRNTRGVR